MKKVGFFGGTFDPIHFGHINLALQLKEILALDEVLICPANISPQKSELPPVASPKDRLNMISIMIEGIEGFRLLDMEIQRKGISYTIDSVRFILSKKLVIEY